MRAWAWIKPEYSICCTCNNGSPESPLAYNVHFFVLQNICERVESCNNHPEVLTCHHLSMNISCARPARSIQTYSSNIHDLSPTAITSAVFHSRCRLAMANLTVQGPMGQYGCARHRSEARVAVEPRWDELLM